MRGSPGARLEILSYWDADLDANPYWFGCGYPQAKQQNDRRKSHLDPSRLPFNARACYWLPRSS
jgi:hypothetical protein